MKKQLDAQWLTFDKADFIKNDPIQIVHEMKSKSDKISDIEICAILTAMVSWGQRTMIIKAARNLMDKCNWNPTEYIVYGDCYDIDDNENVYRTLKGKQFREVCHNLRLFYSKHLSIYDELHNGDSVTLEQLMTLLCNWMAPARLGSPERNSACKRINMLLRWMVRKDEIDLGLWQTPQIQPANLYAIMDTHVVQEATRRGLISYSKESWKAVMELTDVYRCWDSVDPLKYDFVLMYNSLSTKK